ncbi:MAG: PAS domain-containing protein [Acidobacteriia bacterium]|nr:PAS domain-containing protein [Terriglobia bacterium]
MASKKDVSSGPRAARRSPAEATQTAAPTAARKEAAVDLAAGLSAPPRQALAVCYISQPGNLSHWQSVSPQIEALTGVPAKEWLATPDAWIQHVHPDDRASALQARQQIQECGGRYEIEYRLVARDGSSRWIREIASVTCGLDGKPQYVQGLLSDITEHRKSEQALHASQERLKIALDAADMGTWELDAATGIARWDENLDRLFRTSPDATTLSLEDFHRLVHAEDRPRVRRLFTRALQTGEPLAVEFRVLFPDGAVEWRSSHGHAIRDASGKILRIVGVTQNITAQKSADEALRTSEERYRSLVERLPGIAYIAEIGASGRWYYVSPQIRDYLGYSPEEWLASSDLWFQHIHPDDRIRVLAEEERAQKSRKTLLLEYRITARDGRTVWFRDEAMVLPGADVGAQAPIFYGILYDVTDRKLAEEALRESEARLRLALEAAHLGMWEWRPETNGLFWNEQQSAFYGLQPKDAPRTLEEFFPRVHPDDRERIRQALHASSAGANMPYAVEFRIRRPDGSVRWLASSGMVLRDASGKMLAMRGISQDITERRHLEEQLRSAQKMEAIGQLAGGIAHDFNNLLMVIQGHVELLLGRIGKDPGVNRDAEAIQRAADRASAITQQLLAFSRKQVLQPRVLELCSVVADISSLLRRLIGAEVDLQLALSREPLWVKADEGQMERVVLNLVVNARDAMPGGGTITVETTRVSAGSAPLLRYPEIPPGDYVRLTVRDTGMGMDAATQARIFEPFFTTKQLGKGTGLGLATVYGIVQQSGGWISVNSVLEQGTTFEILLPAVAAPATEKREARSGSGSLRGTETLLVVDDEEGVREVAVEFLTAQGYTVLAAESGKQALELARKHPGPIHLVVTDAVMPGMNGPAMVKWLGEIRSGFKVLYISGYADEGSILEEALARGEHFLQKPFFLDVLGRTVRSLLD